MPPKKRKLSAIIKLQIKAGLIEGQLLDGKGVEETLAKMPGKNELRAMLLGVISGPARSLATLLAAPGSSLARVVQAHADSKPAEAATA